MYTNPSVFTSSIFDELRERVPLDFILDVNGHRKAACVDHDDRIPSMHVYGDRVHCFACGFHGDVTDVWAKMRGIADPIEAALDLARDWGIRLPELSVEGRKEAEERRHREEVNRESSRGFHEMLKHKQPRVRDWWEGRGFGPDLQERFLLGASKDGTEAIIPFWHRGRIKGLIRRKLEGEPKYRYPSAEDFVDGHRPLFIPGPLRGDTFLVEGIVDALAVSATGRSVVAVGGTNVSDAQREELLRVVPEEAKLYILPDADESGAAAALEWGRRFFPQARICPPSYGDGSKDIADFFKTSGSATVAEQLSRLAAASEDAIDLEMKVAANIGGGPREKLSYARENIVPLLARIGDDGLRDATADIVVDAVKGLKKSWLTKSIKDHTGHLQNEWAQGVIRQHQADVERAQAAYAVRIGEAQPEIDALFEPGVLARLREAAAKMHNVEGDEKPLELGLLVALGAQLAPLPNGRPLGASILLTAPAGRGKNHIADAAVKPLPPEFYFSFEIASGQSLYYKADEDPDFLKHTFAYPNEIEGAEQLWEFLRPMLSKGRATKIVTAKDADGNMVSRTIVVEGPVTIAIPTIRNKTDEQLQTRLLVAELPDYVGRVGDHSRAISRQFLPEAAAEDFSHEQWLWQEGLRQLTQHRRVVIPLRHPNFTFDNDGVSHGARLWANLLSLMVTNAWLEQKNRRLIEIGDEIAIEAAAEDYEVAYGIFTKVAKMSITGLKEIHRKILNGLYKLHTDNPGWETFAQRKVADAAGVSLSTVSENKAFLVSSAKLVREGDTSGLALVDGAEPSWWEEGDYTAGLPTPAQVRSWWPKPPDDGEKASTSPKSAEHAEYGEHGAEHDRKPHTFAENGVRHLAGHEPNTRRTCSEGAARSSADEAVTERVRQTFGNPPNTENGIPMPNTGEEEDDVRPFGVFGDFPGSQENIVMGKLAAPDPWLAKQRALCREDPDRFIKSTSCAVAADALGSANRSQEVKPTLEAYLSSKDEGVEI